jgi:hypothetical protein
MIEKIKKYNARFILTCLLGLILLAGCRNVDQSGNHSQRFLSIDRTNINFLTEILNIPPLSNVNSVIGTHFNPVLNELFIIYSPQGITSIWDLNKNEKITSYQTNISTESGIAFDNTGNFFSGAMNSSFIDDGFFNKEYLGDIGFWEIKTGELKICIEGNCQKDKKLENKESIFALTSPIGVKIEPFGNWGLIYGLRSIKYVDLRNNEITTDFLDIPKGEELKLIGNVTFDSQGKKIAIAYQEGGVIIRDPHIDLFSNIVELNSDKKVHFPVTALVFSPDNRWLARSYNNIVNVWEINNTKNRKIIDEVIHNSKALAFDNSSNFLFVGTSENILILDLQSGKEIKRYLTPGLTSFNISSDDKFVIWGDKKGYVHILGRPN